ncbi:MAG: glycosyltransferase, partial [Butyrivibrio sp.]|nr:glycosyltransferase [Butyrivibrio sp.]
MVSIVLPTYNGAQFLKESIDSVIKQTISDWELIIVDDCSTDQTPEIADFYSTIDSRIRVIHNKDNKKLPASLNIGFKNANGDYLSWTSDDNYYYPQAIETMLDYLDANVSCPMVCAGMKVIDKNGIEVGDYEEYSPSGIYYDNSVGACFLYRREVLDTIGWYDESNFGIEDYEYWLRILRECGDIEYIKDTLYAYRVHEKSLTTTRWRDIKYKLNRFRSIHFDEIFDHLSNNPELISGLYFDMVITDAVDDRMKGKFKKKLPHIDMFEGELDDHKPVLLYGAGQFGDKAYELVSENANA